MSNDDFVSNETKICTVCLLELPITEFSTNGTYYGRVLRKGQCKTCNNIRRKLKNGGSSNISKFNASVRQRTCEDVQYTLDDWQAALINWGGRCAYCLCKPAKRGQMLTKDHVVPTVAGGLTVRENIVPACPHCNNSKGATDMVTWFKKQSFFSNPKLRKIQQWQRGEVHNGL